MHKKPRGKLVLHRETLLRLEPAEMVKVAGGDLIPWSEYQTLCWPSAVQSACHTYCPKFTCTRAVVDAEPIPH